MNNPRDNRTESALDRSPHDRPICTHRRPGLINCAACLREAGRLWPQNLTPEELKQEIDSIYANTGAITRRMLYDEQARRIAGRPIPKLY